MFLEFSLLPGIGRAKYRLAIMLWLSGVAVYRTFTSGRVGMCTRLFVHHHCVNVFLRELNFRGLNHEIILTAKFSQSTVFFTTSLVRICISTASHIIRIRCYKSRAL